MAYTFVSGDGDTYTNLQERVWLNSFSSTRYAELAKRALNDSVTAICRRLSLFEAYEVLAFAASTGLVTQPTQKWLSILEVWNATATAAVSGEQAFANAANFPLSRIEHHELGGLSTGTGPYGYIVRRKKAPVSTGFVPLLDVIVTPPPSSGGFVAVKGLQRPAVMSTGSDVTGLGAELDQAVVAFAKAALYDNEGDAEMASYWRTRYEAELRQAIAGGVEDDGPDVVDGTWDC